MNLQITHFLLDLRSPNKIHHVTPKGNKSYTLNSNYRVNYGICKLTVPTSIYSDTTGWVVRVEVMVIKK